MQNDYDMSTTEYKDNNKPKRSYIRTIILALIIGTSAIVILFFVSIQSPTGFVPNTVVTIKQGMTVRGAAHELSQNNIIRSKRLFELFMQTSQYNVIAGDYLFDEPDSMMQVFHRLSLGQYGDVRIRVVIQEGASNKQIANILETVLPLFDAHEFLQKAETLEGYLYPDTYFFFPSVTTDEVLTILNNVFEEKLLTIDQGKLIERDLKDIVIMASIIEKEATSNTEERATISGILWKRIQAGMALQVDAPFLYAIGKGSKDLTIDDLRRDSPYNTYTNRGLPPTPIGNPSLGSIIAAIEPIESPYLFYLHGNDGRVHYARTHDEHVSNKRNYLK